MIICLELKYKFRKEILLFFTPILNCDAIRLDQFKMDTFHEPTTCEPNVLTSFEQVITFARDEHGRIGVFRIKIRSLVQKL